MKQIKAAYDAWLDSLSSERREYIESRCFPRLFKEAFTAGWSACCEVAYDEPLLGHPRVRARPAARVGKPEKPVERCGRCYRPFTIYSTPFVNTYDLLSDTWICWRCAGVENPSKLPSYDPEHVCGLFCDGQDGRNSECAKARRECGDCGRPAGVHGTALDGTPIGGEHPCKVFVEKKVAAEKRRARQARVRDRLAPIVGKPRSKKTAKKSKKSKKSVKK